MPRLARGLLLGAAVVGVAAEWVGFGWADVHEWLPDLAVGWTFVACGLVAWSRRPDSRTGLLMTVTGFAWFAGNLVGLLLYVYLGPLFHCVIAYPSGRLRSRIARVAVGVSYATALLLAVGRSEPTAIALAVLLGVVSAWTYIRAVGKERRARLPALQAALVLGLVLAGAAAARLAVPAGDLDDAVLLVYEAALMAIAVGLLLGLLRAPWESARLTDLVVELGDASSDTLRDELARELGDPTLQVGYWLAASSAYIDTAGELVELPEPGTRRAVTRVERDGQPLAALVHDPAVLDDPSLIEGVAAAARLAAANARLQAEVRTQLVELAASRRRILEAGDEERRRLELRLREGAVQRLEALEGTLATAGASADSTICERLNPARSQLGLALADLHELARGLHPRELALGGLERTLRTLAARSPVPVVLTLTSGRVELNAEAAAYFVCSEALANIAKHASASSVAIRISRTDERLEVEVADDGVGGADARRGSGLRGLMDRLEALGGSLRIDSRRGRGTRLEAAIPLAIEPKLRDLRTKESA